MWSNYLKIAYRNLAKNKSFSLINIVGLSIGLAACFLIFQFVNFELSYDKFHSKHDRIYRIINDRYLDGKQVQHGTMSYPAVGPIMAKDYPEIESNTRVLITFGETIIKADNQVFVGDKSLFADHNFFTVFDFPLLYGDGKVALTKKSVLSF
jgi:putative ABC transport system permease protein